MCPPLHIHVQLFHARGIAKMDQNDLQPAQMAPTSPAPEFAAPAPTTEFAPAPVAEFAPAPVAENGAVATTAPAPAQAPVSAPPGMTATDSMEYYMRKTAADTEAATQHKSVGLAYALWFFFGGLGGHRFYLGHIGYALGMLFTLGGLGIWALIDAFLLAGAVRRKNDEITHVVRERHGVV